MSNDVTNYIPQMLAMGLTVLRRRLVMTRVCNRGYDMIPGSRFSTVDVPVSSAIAVNDVTPAATPPGGTDIVPTMRQITVDQWKEAPFVLSDNDLMKIRANFIPLQLEEAVKALANTVENHILSKRVKIGQWGGSAGTTPFATDLTAYTAARAKLNANDIDKDPRYVVLDSDAEANALNLRAFQDASFRGDAQGILEGDIGRKLGANWTQSNNIGVHTQAGAGTPLVDNVAGYAIGTTVIHTDGWTTKPEGGDLITIGGQQYSVVSSTTLAGTDSDVTISPGLRAAVANDDAITQIGNYTYNLLCHRDAFYFASRPLAETNLNTNLAAFDTIVDEESALALRLELTRQHKQWRWSFDMLWGAEMIRPEGAAYILG